MLGTCLNIIEVLSFAKDNTDGKDSWLAHEEQPDIHSMEIQEIENNSENQCADLEDVIDLIQHPLVSLSISKVELVCFVAEKVRFEIIEFENAITSKMFINFLHGSLGCYCCCRKGLVNNSLGAEGVKSAMFEI